MKISQVSVIWVEAAHEVFFLFHSSVGSLKDKTSGRKELLELIIELYYQSLKNDFWKHNVWW